MDALTAGLTVIGFAGTIFVNAVVISRASGKTEGIIRTEIKGLAGRTDRLEEDSTAQWKEIGRHTAEIGFLQGKVNGKARAAE